MKIGRVANLGMGNSIIAFIFQIDQIFINFSYCFDMLSFQYQRRSNLVGITHNGAISFVSDCYGGRASEFIVDDSGCLAFW